jgi:hypothetical protein
VGRGLFSNFQKGSLAKRQRRRGKDRFQPLDPSSSAQIKCTRIWTGIQPQRSDPKSRAWILNRSDCLKSMRSTFYGSDLIRRRGMSRFNPGRMPRIQWFRFLRPIGTQGIKSWSRIGRSTAKIQWPELVALVLIVPTHLDRTARSCLPPHADRTRRTGSPAVVELTDAHAVGNIGP